MTQIDVKLNWKWLKSKNIEMLVLFYLEIVIDKKLLDEHKKLLDKDNDEERKK